MPNDNNNESETVDPTEPNVAGGKRQSTTRTANGDGSDARETDSRPPTEVPKNRLRYQILSFASALILLTIAIAYVARAPIAGAVLMNRLATSGIEDPSFSVQEFDFQHMLITSLVMGPGGTFEADSIMLHYGWRDLLAGEVRAIEIERPRMRLLMNERGLRTGGVEIPFKRQYRQLDTLQRLRVRHGTVAAETPMGAVILRFDGTLQREHRWQSASFTVAIDTPFGDISGVTRAQLGNDGAINGTLNIEQGTLRLPSADLTGVTGNASFQIANGQLQTGGLQITVSENALRTVGLKTANLTGAMSDGRATFNGILQDATGAFDAELRTTVRDIGTQPRITVTGHGAITAQSVLWSLLDLPAPIQGGARFDLVTDRAIGGIRSHETGEAGLDTSLTLRLDGISYENIVNGLDLTMGVDLIVRSNVITLTSPAEGLIGIKQIAPAIYHRAGIEPPPNGPLRVPLSIVIERPTDGQTSLILRSDHGGPTIQLNSALSVMSANRPEKGARAPVVAILPISGTVVRRGDTLIFSPATSSPTAIRPIDVRGQPWHAACALALALVAQAAAAR